MQGFVTLKSGYYSTSTKLEWGNNGYQNDMNQMLTGMSKMAQDHVRNGTFALSMLIKMKLINSAFW